MKNIEPPIKALRLLSTLAEEKGLLRAAERLAMSQSGASHMLAALEKTIGVPLVIRSHSGIKLSETGSRLLPHVRQILMSFEAIRDEVGSLTGLQKGTLRIAAVPSVAGTFLPRLMREFNVRFPGIDVSLFEGTENEVGEWVSQGMAHVGFASLPQSGVRRHDITRDEWLALVPSGDFTGQDKVSLTALSRRKFLLSGGGCEGNIRQLFRDSGLDLPAHLTIKQMSTIHAMVAEGLGVSVVPAMAVPRPPKGVRTLRLSPRQFRRIGLLLPEKGVQTPALAAWTSLVKNHFSRDPEQSKMVSGLTTQD